MKSYKFTFLSAVLATTFLTLQAATPLDPNIANEAAPSSAMVLPSYDVGGTRMEAHQTLSRSISHTGSNWQRILQIIHAHFGFEDKSAYTSEEQQQHQKIADAVQQVHVAQQQVATAIADHVDTRAQMTGAPVDGNLAQIMAPAHEMTLDSYNVGSTRQSAHTTIAGAVQQTGKNWRKIHTLAHAHYTHDNGGHPYGSGEKDAHQTIANAVKEVHKAQANVAKAISHHFHRHKKVAE